MRKRLKYYLTLSRPGGPSRPAAELDVLFLRNATFDNIFPLWLLITFICPNFGKKFFLKNLMTSSSVTHLENIGREIGPSQGGGLVGPRPISQDWLTDLT